MWMAAGTEGKKKDELNWKRIGKVQHILCGHPLRLVCAKALKNTTNHLEVLTVQAC